MSELLEEQATVQRLEGDMAWVATQRRSACDHCQASSGCGSGVLSALLGRRRTLTLVDNVVRAQVGDTVVIGLPNDRLLRAALGVYLWPLLALIALAATAKLVGFGDGVTATAALTGLAAGMWITGCYMRSPARAARYRPTLLRRGAPGGGDRLSCNS
jgi:sigma-E factor negative regulatory protein RseC